MNTHQTVDTVVVGAGHAGLAVSRLLTEAGRDHVVLDRGRIAERWRTERWDSLRLLTPAWMTRLPGWYPGGRDPEGFLSAAELTAYLERYAASFEAPVLSGTTVRRVAPARGGGYDVRTDAGTWRTRNVVVATGPHGPNRVPVPLADLRAAELLPSSRYRNPGQLAAGGVLVVGASSSGTQIADELARTGREVTLAVGRHTRVPRRYRGLDLFWWLESTGRLARTVDDVADPKRARREPSLQLVGRGPGPEVDADLDLATLAGRGVRLVGRLQELDGDSVVLDDGLPARTAEADRALVQLLDSFDEYAARNGLASELLAPTRPRPVAPGPGPRRLNLTTERIGTVVLAAGHRPDHSWLAVPVTGPDGAIRQYRGVTAAPGVYVVGQRFQHRRDSTFIDGARHDALDVVTHLVTGALPVRATAASEERAA